MMLLLALGVVGCIFGGVLTGGSVIPWLVALMMIASIGAIVVLGERTDQRRTILVDVPGDGPRKFTRWCYASHLHVQQNASGKPGEPAQRTIWIELSRADRWEIGVSNAAIHASLNDADADLLVSQANAWHAADRAGR